MIQTYSSLKKADEILPVAVSLDIQKDLQEKQQFKIPPASEKEALKEIEKFNKFLTKQKLPPIQYTLDPELKQEDIFDGGPEDSPGSRRYIVYYKLLTIESNPLKELPWSIVGTKQPVDASVVGRGVEGNVIFLKNKYYSGPPIPEEVQTRSTQCDYCKTSHRRSYSVILQNKDTGEFKEVGRSCLKYYFGGMDLSKYFERLSRMLDEISDTQNHRNKIVAYSLEDVIAATIHTVEVQKGLYVTNAYIQKNPGSDLAPTGGKAAYFLTAYPDSYMSSEQKQELKTAKEKIPTLIPQAKEVIQWFRTTEPTLPQNEFLDKLRIIARHDSINPKLISFASYLYELYRKEKNKGAEPTKEEIKISEYVGNVGEKMERRLRVKRTSSFSGAYGTVFVYSMLDEAGNEFTWFASSNVLEEGKSYVLLFTIKDHKPWTDKKGNEHKQTVITRAKIIERI